MNRNNIMPACAIAARNFLSAGVAIAPVQNSPLHTLVGDISSPLVADYVGDMAVSSILQYSDEYDDTLTDRSQYTLDSYKTAYALAEVIRANLSLIREKIQPMIKAALDAADQTSRKLEQVAIQTEIVMQEPSKFLTANVYREILQGWAGHGWSSIPQVNFFDNLDLEQIIRLTKGISSTLVPAINDVMERLGAAALMDIFQSTFAITSSGLSDNTKAVVAKVSPLDLDSLVFLMGTTLLDRFVDLPGMTKEFQALKMSEFLGGMAARILAAITNHDQLDQLDIVVLKYPDRQGSVVNLCDPNCQPILVNKDNYLAWLEGGGRPELLYGAMLSTRVVTGHELLESAPMFEKLCEEHVVQIRNTNALHAENTIRTAVTHALLNWVEQTPHPDCCPKSQQQVFNDIRDRMQNTTSYDIMNLTNTLMDIVCDVIYFQTEVKTYIQLLMAYEAKNPGADPKQASVACCLEMLAIWAARCITTVKV